MTGITTNHFIIHVCWLEPMEPMVLDGFLKSMIGKHRSGLWGPQSLGIQSSSAAED